MKGQRHNILLYLPVAMHMGDLLKDDSLDDRTNKWKALFQTWCIKLRINFPGVDHNRG